MDVRVKFNPFASKPAKPQEVIQEILTGLPQASVNSLLDILSTRHPELAPVFKEAKDPKPKTEDLRIYVNNDPVPPNDINRYILRDGDTVSLFLKKS